MDTNTGLSVLLAVFAFILGNFAQFADFTTKLKRHWKPEIRGNSLKWFDEKGREVR